MDAPTAVLLTLGWLLFAPAGLGLYLWALTRRPAHPPDPTPP